MWPRVPPRRNPRERVRDRDEGVIQARVGVHGLKEKRSRTSPHLAPNERQIRLTHMSDAPTLGFWLRAETPTSVHRIRLHEHSFGEVLAA